MLSPEEKKLLEAAVNNSHNAGTKLNFETAKIKEQLNTIIDNQNIINQKLNAIISRL